MRLNHKGRDRHARRVAVRYGRPMPVVVAAVVHPQIGSELVLRSAEYGERYKNSKVTMLGIEAGLYVVQSKRRKSPLQVAPAHLETV